MSAILIGLGLLGCVMVGLVGELWVAVGSILMAQGGLGKAGDNKDVRMSGLLLAALGAGLVWLAIDLSRVVMG